MSQFLVDTNVCVEYLRNRNRRLVHRFQSVDPTDIVLCSVVLGELYYSAFHSVDPPRNLALLHRLVILVQKATYDDDAALIYGQIRAQLASQGTLIGPHDLQIAAIALTRNLTVVTHNVGEFSRVPDLSVEDWQV